MAHCTLSSRMVNKACRLYLTTKVGRQWWSPSSGCHNYHDRGPLGIVEVSSKSVLIS